MLPESAPYLKQDKQNMFKWIKNALSDTIILIAS